MVERHVWHGMTHDANTRALQGKSIVRGPHFRACDALGDTVISMVTVVALGFDFVACQCPQVLRG